MEDLDFKRIKNAGNELTGLQWWGADVDGGSLVVARGERGHIAMQFVPSVEGMIEYMSSLREAEAQVEARAEEAMAEAEAQAEREAYEADDKARKAEDDAYNRALDKALAEPATTVKKAPVKPRKPKAKKAKKK